MKVIIKNYWTERGSPPIIFINFRGSSSNREKKLMEIYSKAEAALSDLYQHIGAL